MLNRRGREPPGGQWEEEWKAALALRKAVEETFYLFRLMGKGEDALMAEVLLRRAAMYFDQKVDSDTWDKE